MAERPSWSDRAVVQLAYRIAAARNAVSPGLCRQITAGRWRNGYRYA